MEYVFGNHYENEILKTVDDTETILSGWQETVREYTDCTIKDKYHIVRLIDKVGADGKWYNWYVIDHHTRIIDRWDLIRENKDIARKDTDAAEDGSVELASMVSDLMDAVTELAEMIGGNNNG